MTIPAKGILASVIVGSLLLGDFSCDLDAQAAAAAPAPIIATTSTALRTAATQDDRSLIDNTPSMVVRGSAELDKPADQLTLTLSVVTEAKDVTEALDANSDRMSDVVDAIRKVGLEQGEWSTGRFAIQPQHERPDPRVQRRNGPWEPRIIGYKVTNTISIETTKLELGGELIQKATQAGANQVSSIGFSLSNPRKYRNEAIAEATRNARQDAVALANAAGVKLVRILKLNLDNAGYSPPPMDYAMRGMAMESDSAAPPIEPGDVTVNANVTIIYEIAPAVDNDNSNGTE